MCSFLAECCTRKDGIIRDRNIEIERLKHGIELLAASLSRGEDLTQQDGQWFIFVNGECNDGRWAPTLVELVKNLAIRDPTQDGSDNIGSNTGEA